MVSAKTSITFYDFLNKIVTGFLLLLIINNPDKLKPDVSNIMDSSFKDYEVISYFLLLIVSYIVGMVFSFIVDAITIDLRNNPSLIKEAWLNANNKEEDDFNNAYGLDSKRLLSDYLQAYYKLMKNGMLNSIPILEPQEKFVRQLIVLIIVKFLISRNFPFERILPFFLFACIVLSIIVCSFKKHIREKIKRKAKGICEYIWGKIKCDCAKTILFCSLALAICCICDELKIYLFAILLLIFIWYDIQMKIHYLVWEGVAYLDDTCHSGGHKGCFKNLKRIKHCLLWVRRRTK